MTREHLANWALFGAAFLISSGTTNTANPKLLYRQIYYREVLLKALIPRLRRPPDPPRHQPLLHPLGEPTGVLHRLPPEARLVVRCVNALSACTLVCGEDVPNGVLAVLG